MNEVPPKPNVLGTPVIEPGWQKAMAESMVRALIICVIAVLISIAITFNDVPGEFRWYAGLGYTVAWIFVYVFYFRRQMRDIQTKGHPGVRAWETLIVGAFMFITIFANMYHLISEWEPGSFTEPLDLFVAYYFTVTVLGTVGFGDITPVTVIARSVSMVQMIVDIGIVAVSVRLITSELRRSAAAQRATPPHDS